MGEFRNGKITTGVCTLHTSVYCTRFVVIHAIDPLLSEICFCTAGQIRAKSVLAIEVIMVEAR